MKIAGDGSSKSRAVIRALRVTSRNSRFDLSATFSFCSQSPASSICTNNLKKQVAADHQIFFVGNVMIDTLRKHEARFKQPKIWEQVKLKQKRYLVLTLHRPSNVDEKLELKRLIEAISSHSRHYPIIFPVHPRTRKMLEDIDVSFDNLHYIEPMGYLEFNYLVKHSFAVITDSGGITEETTVMNVPCMTLRENTERPETCSIGTNVLVGKDLELLKTSFDDLFEGHWKNGQIPELWDGKAAERIIDNIWDLYNL